MGKAIAATLFSLLAVPGFLSALRLWREAAEAAGARPPRQARRRGRRNDHG